MSDNPYANQGQRNNDYGNNNNGYQNRNNGGGYQRRDDGGYRGSNNGGGGGFRKGGGGGRGGWTPPEYTPEQIAAAYVPLSVAFLGNDKPNDAIVSKIIRVVKMFEAKKFIIRTGAERGVPKIVIDNAMSPELHIPFKDFDDIQKPASYYSDVLCEEIARKMKQDLDTAPKIVKALYAKNPRVIFGKNLKSPCNLLIIWTEDGCENPADVTNQSGIGGHACKLAAAAGIPVINLQNADAESRVEQYLRTLYVEAQQGTRPQTDERPRANDQHNGSNPGTYGGQPGSDGGRRPEDHHGQQSGNQSYGNQSGASDYY